jgi:N-acetylneuraminic acid mutarotase
MRRPSRLQASVAVVVVAAMSLASAMTMNGAYNQWSSADVSPISPDGRMFHSMTLLPHGSDTDPRCGRLWLIFGGMVQATQQHKFVFLNETWLFRLQENYFLQLNTSKSPSARAGHSTVALGEHVYLFGGFDSNGPIADVWRFSFADCSRVEQRGVWERVVALGGPQPRWGHAALTPNNGTSMYIFGGLQESWEPCGKDIKSYSYPAVSSDTSLWEFHPQDNTWRSLVVLAPAGIPSPRGGHSFVRFNETILFLFGG